MASLTPRISFLLAGVLCSAAPIVAQDYRDFTLVRNREQPYTTLLQIRAGYSGTEAEGQDNLITGHASDDEIDGFVYFHSKDLFRGEDWIVDAYGGIDGIYLGLKGDLHAGKKSQTRIEVFGQHSAFYRPGYYEKGAYVPVGHYTGEDYGVRIGTAQVVDRGLIMEISAFYRQYEFGLSDEPLSLPSNQFQLPDDFDAYGVDITLEQNSLQMDRVLGLPKAGLLWALQLDYETNDSTKKFGWVNQGLKGLSETYYRGETRLEGYIPNGRSSAWEIMIDAGYYDSTDVIRASRSNKVQGYIWGDGTLGYRMAFGQSFILKPFFQLQYSKSLDVTGVSSREKMFWGGGAQASVIFAKNIALVFEYSYVDNPARVNIARNRDLYGEHQFFIGMDVSFGSGYRSR